MKFILLFTAISNSAFMGEFDNKAACDQAMRRIIVNQIASPTVVITPQLEQAIDERIRIRPAYICVPKG